MLNVTRLLDTKQVHKATDLTMDKLLLKIPEVCMVIQLGRSTVYELLDQPDGLPTVRIGRAVRVPAEAVLQWVERQQQTHKDDSTSRE